MDTNSSQQFLNQYLQSLQEQQLRNQQLVHGQDQPIDESMSPAIQGFMGGRPGGGGGGGGGGMQIADMVIKALPIIMKMFA